MKRLSLLFVIVLALLSGCASDEYYKSLTAQFNLQMKQLELDEKRLAKQKSVPLVNHSWVDIDGNTHSLIVNQPAGNNQVKQQKPVFQIPSPWEGTFKFFDRTLSTAERIFPFAYSAKKSGNNKSYNNIYNLGDNNKFQNTAGNNSPTDMLRDNSQRTTNPPTTTE